MHRCGLSAAAARRVRACAASAACAARVLRCVSHGGVGGSSHARTRRAKMYAAAQRCVRAPRRPPARLPACSHAPFLPILIFFFFSVCAIALYAAPRGQQRTVLPAEVRMRAARDERQRVAGGRSRVCQFAIGSEENHKMPARCAACRHVTRVLSSWQEGTQRKRSDTTLMALLIRCQRATVSRDSQLPPRHAPAYSGCALCYSMARALAALSRVRAVFSNVRR